VTGQDPRLGVKRPDAAARKRRRKRGKKRRARQYEQSARNRARRLRADANFVDFDHQAAGEEDLVR
jgi:hypothetical protein